MARAGAELRASMTLQRPLTFSALLACLLLATPAAATDSGGVAVESYDGVGGGILAPLAPAPEPAAPVPAPAAPVAQAAQGEETPTTPEGQEQPEGEENGVQTPTEENGGADGEETAGGGGGGSGGETAGGFLPHTGFELAALSAIGLGLLLAGGALWPTGSWPQPRDRLGRSTPRR
jgi:hypothetical protein